MNLRIRLSLLFTATVVLILLISSITIYYFYQNEREQDFSRRLKNNAALTFDEFKEYLDEKKIGTVELSEVLDDDFLFERTILILDSNNHKIASFPEQFNAIAPTTDLEIARLHKTYFVTIGNRQLAIIYHEKEKVFIQISAEDKDGLTKLKTLRWILILAFLIGLLITGLSNFFFVKSALKPLVVLKNQILRVNELNLSEKIWEGNGKDEISNIAKSFNEILQRLHKAFDTQKTFVQYASHELRTPLANMNALTGSALNKDLTNEEYKSLLLSLTQDQNNLVELTNSLLLLSQTEKLESTTSWQTFRIDELLYESISYTKKNYPNGTISFEYANLPESEEVLSVKGNEHLLKSAITNLLKNGIIYSEDATVSVSIELHPNGMYIYFDSKGIHLLQEDFETLKTPFARGKNNKSYKGFGLGLSIVEKIVMMHHGRFEYSNSTPQINRFTIFLFNEGYSDLT